MITEHKWLRWFFFPLALLFGIVVGLKNLCYQTGILHSVRFNIPVINVGNLTVGGSGKTPHIEYLIRMLQEYLRIAVLSRGYGRHTTGFQFVVPSQYSTEAGDESLMYARKYPSVKVAVSESRSVGIPYLLQAHPDLQLILLDDAFQHRSVAPHLNILLTDYSAPFYDDWLMPVGRLREWRSGYHRADIVIVTKCPPDLQKSERLAILTKLQLGHDQSAYFTSLRYRLPYGMYDSSQRLELTPGISVLLVCGIARKEPLVEYVSSHAGVVDILSFGDHHEYSFTDIEVISSRFTHLPGTQKVIITTEKDAVRLEVFGDVIIQRTLPVYVLPVEVIFLFDDSPAFASHIKSFLLNIKS
jgi:tetraacyldisaccharide 4'-kinase